MSRTKSTILRALLICAAAILGWPALADPGCALKQVASMPMRYVNREILVDFTVDDAPVSFLVDTGAAASVIGSKLASRLKLPVKTLPGAMYGVTGASELHAATVPTLKLGLMVGHNQNFFVDDNFGDGQDRRPAGIFGADYLGAYDFEIDFGAGKFNLYLHDHCPDRVVYWDSEYFKLSFSPGENRTPSVKIPVSVDGHPLRGILDTGAFNTTMRLATARSKLNYDEKTAGDPTLTFGGGASSARMVAYEHRFSTLEFGPITLRNPLIDVAPIDFGKGGAAATGSHINDMRVDQPEIIVGMDVISKLHLYVDYADSAIYFTLAQQPKAAH